MQRFFNLKPLFLLLVAFCSFTSWAQVPANDEPCNAQDVGLLTLGTPVVVNGTTVNATESVQFSTQRTHSKGYTAKRLISALGYKF
jgi:hypothetical protein